MSRLIVTKQKPKALNHSSSDVCISLMGVVYVKNQMIRRSRLRLRRFYITYISRPIMRYYKGAVCH